MWNLATDVAHRNVVKVVGLIPTQVWTRHHRLENARSRSEKGQPDTSRRFLGYRPDASGVDTPTPASNA